MTAPQDDVTTDPQSIIAELRRERDAALAREAALAEALAARTAELATRNAAFDERMEHQAATIDVLKAMSASPSDPQPVFDLIARRARDLCAAYGVTVYEFDGTLNSLARGDRRQRRVVGTASPRSDVPDGTVARVARRSCDPSPSNHTNQ